MLPLPHAGHPGERAVERMLQNVRSVVKGIQFPPTEIQYLAGDSIVRAMTADLEADNCRPQVRRRYRGMQLTFFRHLERNVRSDFAGA